MCRNVDGDLPVCISVLLSTSYSKYCLSREACVLFYLSVSTLPYSFLTKMRWSCVKRSFWQKIYCFKEGAGRVHKQLHTYTRLYTYPTNTHRTSTKPHESMNTPPPHNHTSKHTDTSTHVSAKHRRPQHKHMKYICLHVNNVRMFLILAACVSRKWPTQTYHLISCRHQVIPWFTSHVTADVPDMV